MPTLSVAGHDVTVGDEFLKLSPEDQQQMVNHIAQHLPGEAPPSGVVDGFKHGLAGVAGGNASTLNLAGVPTAPLDTAKENLEPKNYKAAPLIREGGHWYNPADYQPSSIPQIAAEALPGMGQDLASGWAAGKLMPGGLPAKALAGAGGYAGSALLRTFGTGAHENADARTGTPNSPVEAKDLTREAAKQALTLPLNMLGGARLLPNGQVAGSVLGRLGKTIGIEGATGAATDALDQAATTAGSKNGFDIDGNRVATAATGRAIGGALLAAPKAGAEASANRKFAGYEATPETTAAAQAVASRRASIADGRDMVGPMGGTKVAAEAANGAHTDIHAELATASRGEQLSQDNSNILGRINRGEAVSPGEVSRLGAEATPETMHLVQQALISKNENAKGNLTDKSYTGGIGGTMENLPLIRTPVKSVLGTAATVAAGHAGLGTLAGTLGAVAPAALATTAGVYGVGRMIDRLTGSRSPAQAFNERFAGTDTPTRLPVAPPADDPFNPSAGPWGARVTAGPTGPEVMAPSAPEPKQPSLRNTLNANVKIDDGITKIVKRIQSDKQNSSMAELRALVASQPKPASAPEPEAPFAPSPIAKTMLAAKLKAGLPPEPAPEAPAPTPAPEAPNISPVAMMMLKKKLKEGLPPEPASPAAPVPPVVAAPAAAPAPVAPAEPAAPAQPSIEQLINRMKATSAAKAQQNPAATPPGGVVAPEAPVAPTPDVLPTPTVSTLSKLKGQPGIKEKTGASEYMDPDTGEILSHTPLTKDQLYGRNMTHEQFAKHEADAKVKTGELRQEQRDVYESAVVHDRLSRERELQLLSQHEAGPDDTPLAKLLLQELHHTRRDHDARSAIKFYTSHMSPGMRRASAHLMSRHGPFSQMWSK